MARAFSRALVPKPRVSILLLIAAVVCCRAPKTRIDSQAARSGFQQLVVVGKGFKHLVFEGGDPQASGSLHIYLEGDGRPWISDRRISSDPTPRRVYALELMALDAGPTAYIGRPCYHELEVAQVCNPEIWTVDRYSQEVVDSLESAIRKISERRSASNLVLIGYSGGGVLAMLVAERLSSIRVVVTIAANLDIDAWTRLHGYSPLTGSLNPATRPALQASIRQLHLAGGRDERVPAAIVESVAMRQPNSQFIVYPNFDHTCCWVDAWPEIVAAIGDEQ